MSLNQAILIGRVGKDPEIKTVGNNNTKIATFSLATSKNIGNFQNPNWVSTWHNIKAWKKNADFAEANIFKGDEVFVEGEIEVQQWEDKNGGGKRSATFIVANTLRVTKVAESKGEQAPPPQQQQPARQKSSGSQQRGRQQQQQSQVPYYDDEPWNQGGGGW